MRAVAALTHGGPDVLGIVELPDPVPAAGQVRIRVAASTVNPADLMLRAGTLGGTITGPLPHVGGMELAGTVESVGEGTSCRVGDAVVAMTTFIPTGRGSHADLVVVGADSVAEAPACATAAEAATLPMNGLTARLALDALGLPGGSTIAVTGAPGAVGGYAVQLAKHDAMRVVGIAAPRDEELIRRLGADMFVPLGGDLGAGVRSAAPGGVDGLVDAASIAASAISGIRDEGRIALVRPIHAPPERGITQTHVSVRQYLGAQEKLQDLVRLADRGELTLRVAATFAPEDAAEAHRRVAVRRARGRIVLDFA